MRIGGEPSAGRRGGVRLVRTAALVAVLAPALALASSHREAPAISNDPAADNTDLYAWLNADRSKLYVIANWIPFEEPASGPNFFRFSDDVRYAIHVSRGASLDDAIVFEFEFKTPALQRVDPADLSAPPGGGKEFFSQLTGVFAQTYTLTKVTKDASGAETRTVLIQDGKVAPPRIGPRTQQTANTLNLPPFTSPTYDDAFAATFITTTTADSGARVFVGPRDDPFYADLGGLFDLANLRAAGQAQDGLAGFNVHSIALELPVEQLTATGQRPAAPGNDSLVGLWASSSRRATSVLMADGTTQTSGDFVQVSRIGLPLVNEVIIGYQDKDKYNRTTPATDVQNFGAYILNPVAVRDAEAVGLYTQLGLDPTQFRSNRTDIIDAINLTNVPTAGAHSIPLDATGDVLRVDLAIDSAFPNGRPISPGTNHEQADVVDALLALVLTKGQAQISDGVSSNDKTFLADFPFLALPWQGFDEGHGKPPAAAASAKR
jgi:hypothetical protein